MNENTKLFSTTYHQNNKEIILISKTVIDASGNWSNFNQLTTQVKEFKQFIIKGIPSPEKIKNLFIDKSIVIIGNGHSAMNSILLISKHSNAKVSWVIRSNNTKIGNSKVGGRSKGLEEKISALILKKNINLISNFNLSGISIKKEQLILSSNNDKKLSEIDFIVQNNGNNADYSFLKNIPLNLDAKFNVSKRLSQKIDPKKHSCNTLLYNYEDSKITNLDYFVVGIKSFGKASNFLLRSGYNVLDSLINYINRL